MKKYMLISVCDRDILTELFDTHKEAFVQMKTEMTEQGKVPKEVFDETDIYEDSDFGFGPEGGWANDGVNHCNFDWRIVNITEEV
jgi:hypothetical protein